MVKKQRKYDMEYKIQAVKSAKELGGAKAAAGSGIPENTMYAWTKAAREGRLNVGSGSHWSYVKKKYKLNVNSTLIFLIILFQFQVFSILSSIFSHVHSAIRNCSDYESLLYYKMFLYTQIQVCTHAYNP